MAKLRSSSPAPPCPSRAISCVSLFCLPSNTLGINVICCITAADIWVSGIFSGNVVTGCFSYFNRCRRRSHGPHSLLHSGHRATNLPSALTALDSRNLLAARTRVHAPTSSRESPRHVLMPRSRPCCSLPTVANRGVHAGSQGSQLQGGEVCGPSGGSCHSSSPPPPPLSLPSHPSSIVGTFIPSESAAVKA